MRNILIFPVQNNLPGVFANNPLPFVTRVLWTLGLELGAYITLGVLGAVGMFRSSRVLIGLTLVCAMGGWEWLNLKAVGGHLVYAAPRLELLSCFFAAAWVRRAGLVPGAAIAAVAFIVLVVSAVLHAPASIVVVPCGVIIVLFLGTRRWHWARSVTRLGDPSYGMYIYGYTLQQILVTTRLRESPRGIFVLLSLALALFAGYASWHTIERPALLLLRRHAKANRSGRAMSGLGPP